MKRKDIKDLRAKDDEALKKLLVAKQKDLIEAQAQAAAGREKNLKKAKNLRADIAVIMTMVREKEFVKKGVEKGE